MKNKLFTIVLLVAAVTASAADPQNAPQNMLEPILKPAQISAAIREKLSPVIAAALQEHCGNDCPSFRIDVHFKNPSSGLLDDLGFSKPIENSPPELQSISVSVLVQEKVSSGSQESLRQILTHTISNESPVPVTVQLKPLNSLSPYLEKKSHLETPLPPSSEDGRLTWVRTIIWPLSLGFLGLLGVIALLFVLKNRRDLLRDRIAAFHENKNEDNSTTDSPLLFTSPQATNFLETRPNDLQWLIEDLASRQDAQSLNRVILTYQPQDLTSQLKFSNSALRVLASLPPGGEKLIPNEALAWLKNALDRAHWKRIEEQRLPLSKLSRLTDLQRIEVFLKLKSASDRSVMIASVSEDKWPQLLSQISSEERIQLGLTLSHYQNSLFEDRIRMEDHLSAELDGIIQTQSPCSTGILEDFTLYLTETEGKRLWQGISPQPFGKSNNRPPTLSIDTLVQELNPKETAEIFTGLEIGTLGTLMLHLSPESRLKVMGTLPKSLSDRLLTYQGSNNETQVMKARAHLLDAYRKFLSGSMIQ